MNINVSDNIADNNKPAMCLGTSTLCSLYKLYTIVEQHPTGATLTDIGKSVDIPPILWWSTISTILACSIPSALWANSLWSTNTTFFLVGFNKCLLEINPKNLLLSSTTG